MGSNILDPTIDAERVSQLQRILEHPHILGTLMGMHDLSEMHSDWIRRLWLPDESTFLMAHRGAYKTSACIILGIIWRWLFQPDWTMALIRETWKVSDATRETIGKMMRLEAIQQIFVIAHGKAPKVIRDSKGGLLYDFKTTVTKENSLDSYGILQVPTGSHYDEIICDDIVTYNDRTSKAKREATKAALQEIMTNIINPDRYLRITGTPWHRDDAYEMKNEHTGKRILPMPMKYTCHDTGIFTPEQIEAKRGTSTASLFAANMELVHMADEGQIFKNPHYEHWNYQVHWSQVAGHIDAKYSGTHWGAFTIMATKPNGRIQAIGFAFEEHVDEKLAWIKMTAYTYRCRKIHCETNADKGYLARDIQANNDPAKRLDAEAYPESMNKHRKIVTYLKRYWDIIDWDPQTDPNYMNMILDYIEGEEPDDAPDSASSLLREAIYIDDPASSDEYMGLYN